jgi:hypothetical protein
LEAGKLGGSLSLEAWRLGGLEAGRLESEQARDREIIRLGGHDFFSKL